MIQLTRLNGELMYVNPDMIKFVERVGDTRITFVNNSLVIVQEVPEIISQLMFEYKKAIFAGAIKHD